MSSDAAGSWWCACGVWIAATNVVSRSAPTRRDRFFFAAAAVTFASLALISPIRCSEEEEEEAAKEAEAGRSDEEDEEAMEDAGGKRGMWSREAEEGEGEELDDDGVARCAEFGEREGEDPPEAEEGVGGYFRKKKLKKKFEERKRKRGIFLNFSNKFFNYYLLGVKKDSSRTDREFPLAKKKKLKKKINK